jgi:uncharacterized membrane protein
VSQEELYVHTAKEVRMSRSRTLVRALIVSLGATLAVQAQAAIEFFDIPGAEGTTAWAINLRGDVVGTTLSKSATVFHGYQRDRSGTVTTVDAVAPNCTSARGISPSGEIVGFFQKQTCGGTQFPTELRPGAHGFVVKNGPLEIVDVKLPGTVGTIVMGINPAGDLVGGYSDAANKIHGFLRNRGTITTIDGPGAGLTICRGINDNGEIVGRFDGHGFLRRADATFETIDFPGAASTVVGGINPQGDIVGRFVMGGVVHGFLRRAGGQPVQFDVPGAATTDPTGISPSGEIVGTVTILEGGKTKTRGFIQR